MCGRDVVLTVVALNLMASAIMVIGGPVNDGSGDLDVEGEDDIHLVKSGLLPNKASPLRADTFASNQTNRGVLLNMLLS